MVTNRPIISHNHKELQLHLSIHHGSSFFTTYGMFFFLWGVGRGFPDWRQTCFCSWTTGRSHNEQHESTERYWEYNLWFCRAKSHNKLDTGAATKRLSKKIAVQWCSPWRILMISNLWLAQVVAMRMDDAIVALSNVGPMARHLHAKSYNRYAARVFRSVYRCYYSCAAGCLLHSYSNTGTRCEKLVQRIDCMNFTAWLEPGLWFRRKLVWPFASCLRIHAPSQPTAAQCRSA